MLGIYVNQFVRDAEVFDHGGGDRQGVDLFDMCDGATLHEGGDEGSRIERDGEEAGF